ncbi:MAG: hypothetical protein K9N06_03535 [Candidatus Cloacimonetes bacterium]|nr:hypothetical protein [Candidatus Cloacimonadota bacterium]
MNVRVITTGLLNRTQVHPREAFTDAISDQMAEVILAHNHTNSNLNMSNEDIACIFL